jgi:ABC-type uncharacterized transport system auxiliary subunit
VARTDRASTLLAALALLLALAGCAPSQQERVLRLDIAAAPEAGRAILDGSVQIVSFGARGLLSEPRLAYVDWRAPGEQLQYAAVRWDESPARTVERALAHYLRKASPGLAVFDADSRAAADYWISGRLDRFEQVVRPGGNEVAVALDVTLMRTRDRSLVLTGSYCASAPMQGEDVATSLPAFEAALIEIFAGLTDDLRARPAPAGRAGHGC